ncbi:DUF2891 family protein [Cronobacter sakazakii]|uniref:DUF2891 family protein n=1 Tax=Cronobacter sakazakii TaxID=28141 RepID=UPI001F3986DB
MRPAILSGRSGPKIARLAVLSVSRAGCMKHIAAALPEDHPAQMALQEAVQRHLRRVIFRERRGDMLHAPGAA